MLFATLNGFWTDTLLRLRTASHVVLTRLVTEACACRGDTLHAFAPNLCDNVLHHRSSASAHGLIVCLLSPNDLDPVSADGKQSRAPDKTRNIVELAADLHVCMISLF